MCHNPRVTITWKPFHWTERRDILCKGCAPVHDLFCLSRVSWWIKHAEQRLAQSKLFGFPGDWCAVNSVSALIKWGKNTCHLLTSRHTARTDRAHSTLNFSGGKSFMKATFFLSGTMGENETRPMSRTHAQWDIHLTGTGLQLLSKSAFPTQGWNVHSWQAGVQWPMYLWIHEERDGIWRGLEGKFFPWYSTRDGNIGEERTHEGQSMAACSAPRAGRTDAQSIQWCWANTLGSEGKAQRVHA